MHTLEGEQICPYCNKIFTWYYDISENSDNVKLFTVSQRPKDAVKVFCKHSKETNKNELQARCKYCDRLVIIDDMDS